MKTIDTGYLVSSTSIRPSGAMFTTLSLNFLSNLASAYSASVKLSVVTVLSFIFANLAISFSFAT